MKEKPTLRHSVIPVKAGMMLFPVASNKSPTTDTLPRLLRLFPLKLSEVTVLRILAKACASPAPVMIAKLALFFDD